MAFSQIAIIESSELKNPDNFFYNLCNDPRYGFVEFHAKTMDNLLLPKRDEGEAEKTWRARRARLLDDQPVPPPSRCGSVFAVIDTAVKTGTDNDGTAITFFCYDKHAPVPS